MPSSVVGRGTHRCDKDAASTFVHGNELDEQLKFSRSDGRRALVEAANQRMLARQLMVSEAECESDVHAVVETGDGGVRRTDRTRQLSWTGIEVSDVSSSEFVILEPASGLQSCEHLERSRPVKVGRLGRDVVGDRLAIQRLLSRGSRQ